MVACFFGNSAIVSRLVQESGLDINYQDEEGDGDTAAILATMLGKTECVRILAETGRVDWTKPGAWGKSPLFLALWQGDSDIVEIILQQSNIDYSVESEDGISLAQIAVTKGDMKCVETVAAQESFNCWNVPDMRGDTPIMWALKVGKTEIVEILLRCPRVDLSCRDKEGWSLVFRAIHFKELGEKNSKY